MESQKGIFLTGMMVGAILCFAAAVIAYNIAMIDAAIVPKEIANKCL